jgi:hypothetical protein
VCALAVFRMPVRAKLSDNIRFLLLAFLLRVPRTSRSVPFRVRCIIDYTLVSLNVVPRLLACELLALAF